MIVYVGKMPGGVYEINAPDGATVGFVLGLAKAKYPEISFDGTKSVSHRVVDDAHVLHDGETVFVTDNIKGNQTGVIIRKIPGKETETSLTFSGNTTIRSILNEANKPDVMGGPIGSIDGYSVRYDGVEKNLDDTVADDGQTHRIFLSTKLKGN